MVYVAEDVAILTVNVFAASIFVAALLSLPSSSAASPSTASTNTQPIARGTLKRFKRSSNTIDDGWLKGHREYLKTKYTAGSQSTPAKRQTYDYAYYTSVSVGTPAVNYDVLLDTGSSDLWEVDNTAALAQEPGGSFTIGAVDSSLYTGGIEYVNIPNGWNTWWLIPMTQITMGSSVLNLGSQLTAIDTGTTLIGGPANVVEAIYSQIPNVQRGTGDNAGYYFYPCETEVNIALTFGNKSWPMNPADFAYSSQDGMCLGAIFAVELGSPGSLAPEWIIGDAFLKNVYSVFRYYPPSVGFAQLANPQALTQPQQNLTLTVPVATSSVPSGVLTLGGPSGSADVGVTLTSVAPFATVSGSRTNTNSNSNSGSARISSSWTMGIFLGA
ncbi:hypothetical protein FRB90_000513, partial [Tulasnella sp. 427]